jgi:hypothetical protein
VSVATFEGKDEEGKIGRVSIIFFEIRTAIMSSILMYNEKLQAFVARELSVKLTRLYLSRQVDDV